jgi:hypothetical protein
MVVVINPSEAKPSMGKSIRNIAAVARAGLDLARSAFQVHAVDAKGETVVARKLTWGRLVASFADLPRGASECCSARTTTRLSRSSGPANRDHGVAVFCLLPDAQPRHLILVPDPRGDAWMWALGEPLRKGRYLALCVRTGTAQGRLDPFAEPSASDRYLRIAVVHCVVFAPQKSPNADEPPRRCAGVDWLPTAAEKARKVAKLLVSMG